MSRCLQSRIFLGRKLTNGAPMTDLIYGLSHIPFEQVGLLSEVSTAELFRVGIEQNVQRQIETDGSEAVSFWISDLGLLYATS